MSGYCSCTNHPVSDYLAQYYYGTSVLMRDLIRDMFGMIEDLCDSHTYCYSCPMTEDDGVSCKTYGVRDRIRALGIEVQG